MRLADVVDRWIGKVEIVLAGADGDLRAGQEALSAGDPLGARAAARRVLVRAPDSPLGLALLADACEAAGLEAELALTLEELARRVPSRAEVWVRLGRARAATLSPTEDVRDAFARGLAVAEPGSDARRDALVGLADLDLSLGEGNRAELWLERAAGDSSPPLQAARAEALLLLGDAAGAKKLLDGVTIAPTDARGQLVLGRTLTALDDPAAFVPLVRAMVLDAPGASEALSTALSRLPSSPQVRTHVRSVVDAKGEQGLARWRAAFARAEGARGAAREALAAAVLEGDAAAAGPLLHAAVEDRDESALRIALGSPTEADGEAMANDARRLAHALSLAGAGQTVDALDALASVAQAALLPWTEQAAADFARVLVPPTANAHAENAPADASPAAAPVPGADARAAWPELLGRLDRHAHTARDLDAAARIGELATERSRPLRLAIVGEFNAGKSTFINALMGTDVAPTGVLPTTATLHHLLWAPDPFAKIVFARGRLPAPAPAERILPTTELRDALKRIDPSSVERVDIGMPLPALVRVEIIDTPGFNAPDPRHADVARAGLEEAEIALWLLDATQAMKDSERAILDEAQQKGVPVQILLNKADRLSGPEIERVMAAVREAPVRSWGPILAFSAKKALAGKTGDAAAAAASGWSAVESLLEEHILARSGDLKERALRRRATTVVLRLQEAFRRMAADEDSEAERRAQRAHEAGLAAAALEAEQADVAGKLSRSLAPHAVQWQRDIELVFVGRDRESAARDPVLARYRVDRALTTLAPPLARALASLAPPGSVTPAAMEASARAIVRAAAFGSAVPDDDTLAAIASAAVATLIEELFSRSIPPASPRTAAGVLRELGAFACALA
ncbi:MAG TPA: dynamin family protein [Polyangiaceae bacterium]|nr:dynamin family protein [Polyangiaceae bacterium]